MEAIIKSLNLINITQPQKELEVGCRYLFMAFGNWTVGTCTTPFNDKSIKALSNGTYASLKASNTLNVSNIYKLPSKSELNTQTEQTRLSFHTCDAEITKHVDTLSTKAGQDQYTHDTAFIEGAIWMRERIMKYLNEQK